MTVTTDGMCVNCSSTSVDASCQELTSVVAMCVVLWAVTLWAKAPWYGIQKRNTVYAVKIFEKSLCGGLKYCTRPYMKWPYGPAPGNQKDDR